MIGTVDDIKSKIDIVQVISEKISVKKSGKHFKALCPFHGEKTPSFMISPELQIFKCFGCGESGDVITFLEKFEGMDFNEVLSDLSERTGIKLEQGDFQPKKDKEKIIELNSLAAKYYQYLLLKHEAGKVALDYLTQKRKMDLETIRKFNIGYSPEKPQLFESFFLKKKGLKNYDLTMAGLSYDRYGRPVDRFLGRIVFPLFDHRGAIVGFSGRILNPKGSDSAKYINTPETPAYHKSEILFGLNFTKSDIKEKGYVIIVEGELDMISPWQRGVKNIVAIKGSALTEAHARLIGRFTKNITLALDADFAGNAAAKRGIEVAQKMGLKIKVARIKGFKDPDEVAVNDIDKFSKFISSAVPVYDFVIESALEKYDVDSVDGKIDVSKEVIPFLTRIEDEILKAYYIEVLSKKLKVPYESVYSEVEKGKIDKMSDQENTQNYSGKPDRREVVEEMLMILQLIESPKKVLELRKIFRSPFNEKIIDRLAVYLKNKKFEIKEFSEGLPPELKTKFNEIYLLYASDVEGLNNDKILKEIEMLQKSLDKLRLTDSQKILIGKIKESETAGDKVKVKSLQGKLNELVKVRVKLEEVKN